MKLVSYIMGEEERIGAIDTADRIVDLHRAYGNYLQRFGSDPDLHKRAAATLGHDMVEFLQRGTASLSAARQALAHIAAQPMPDSSIVLDRREVRLLAPVPRPGAVISAGKNFSDHVAEMSSRSGPNYPVAFLKLPGTIVGADTDIPHPPEVKNLDYEAEVAVIIGRTCSDVNAEDALAYVAGYAAFNDISARDVIRRENRTGIHLMGKNFPGFAPMGPCLVMADEIPEPQKLRLSLRVNGETRQDSNLGFMIFKIRDMIAYWSQMGLNPGDVLTTGTPRGVAAGRKPDETPWWLKSGDVMEVEVENVGLLRNRIVSEKLNEG